MILLTQTMNHHLLCCPPSKKMGQNKNQKPSLNLVWKFFVFDEWIIGIIQVLPSVWLHSDFFIFPAHWVHGKHHKHLKRCHSLSNPCRMAWNQGTYSYLQPLLPLEGPMNHLVTSFSAMSYILCSAREVHGSCCSPNYVTKKWSRWLVELFMSSGYLVEPSTGERGSAGQQSLQSCLCSEVQNLDMRTEKIPANVTLCHFWCLEAMSFIPACACP